MEELRRTAGLVHLCLGKRLQRLRLGIFDTTTSTLSNIEDLIIPGTPLVPPVAEHKCATSALLSDT